VDFYQGGGRVSRDISLAISSSIGLNNSRLLKVPLLGLLPPWLYPGKRTLLYLSDKNVKLLSVISLCTDADTDANLPPSTKDPETDHDFHVRLTADSNAVASKKQLHYTATCFKYAQSSTGKKSCRFGMPRDLTTVNEFGIVHLARNHGWINPWNPAIATCIRSNHDLSWVPTMSKD
jgi:hypothetical protein